MLETIKIPTAIKDIIKVIVGIKVIAFIVIVGIEGLQNIRELEDTNRCVEQMKEEYKAKDEKNMAAPLSRAIHFCNGGVVVSR